MLCCTCLLLPAGLCCTGLLYYWLVTTHVLVRALQTCTNLLAIKERGVDIASFLDGGYCNIHASFLDGTSRLALHTHTHMRRRKHAHEQVGTAHTHTQQQTHTHTQHTHSHTSGCFTTMKSTVCCRHLGQGSRDDRR
jgi:hypothetical protein